MRRHSSLCAVANRIFWSRRTWRAVVSMSRTSVWLSTIKWPILSKLMSTVSVCMLFLASYHHSYLFHLGRTGRAGKQGTAITFLTNDDDEVMCVLLSPLIASNLCYHTLLLPSIICFLDLVSSSSDPVVFITSLLILLYLSPFKFYLCSRC